MEGSELEPRTFSRGELDRVIRRAAELQFERGAEDDDHATLDEAEVRRIAAEVGIEDRFVRRAIGEVRAERLLPEATPESGWLGRLVGVRSVRSDRVVPGSVGTLEARLGEHLEVAESLARVRDRRGGSLWEPESGMLAEIRRGVGWRGYRYELARTTNLQVSLTSMEERFVLVSLVADLGGTRTGNMVGFSIGFGLIGAGAGVAAAVLSGLPVVAMPALGILGALVGVVAGIRAARAVFERSSRRVRLTIEGILDRLERDKPLAKRSLSGDWSKRLKGS